MIRTGTVIGRQSYSFIPENSTKRYDGMRFCIVYDVERSDQPDATIPGDGQFADMVSISFRDLGSDIPQVGDEVRYHVYRDAKGKNKCGFIMLI